MNTIRCASPWPGAAAAPCPAAPPSATRAWSRCLRLGLLLASGIGCSWLPPSSPPPEAPVGRSVVAGGGLSFTLPNAYHEAVGRTGRTYRVRGAAAPSYSTINVQPRLGGAPVHLDVAWEAVLARLDAQDGLDLLDLQLFSVGEQLALSWAAEFDLLDVRRRQWGVLVAVPTGVVAVLMTSPTEGFADASEDFADLLASLQVRSVH